MTPIEKLIKEIDELRAVGYEKVSDDKISDEFIKGTINGLTVIKAIIQVVYLPTEAEYTKQVGTGFAEWLNSSSQYRPIGYNNYRNVAGKIFTIPELFDEYILTLQNKKG